MDRIDQAFPVALAQPIRQGEIYWIAADETRGSVPGIPHPHVVVQDDIFNASRISTVIVCALTSNLQRCTEPGNVLLDPGEGGLPKQSIVVVSQVSCLYKSRLGERIGMLSAERIRMIFAGMKFQQAAFFNR